MSVLKPCPVIPNEIDNSLTLEYEGKVALEPLNANYINCRAYRYFERDIAEIQERSAELGLEIAEIVNEGELTSQQTQSRLEEIEEELSDLSRGLQHCRRCNLFRDRSRSNDYLGRKNVREDGARYDRVRGPPSFALCVAARCRAGISRTNIR